MTDYLPEKSRAQARYDALVQSLPHTCSATVELDWIRCHPAMKRKAMHPMDPVQITPEDLLSVEEGGLAPYRCPAKCCEVSLWHWAQHPEQFYSKYLDQQRKSAEDKKDDTVADELADDDLESLKVFIKSLRAPT